MDKVCGCESNQRIFEGCGHKRAGCILSTALCGSSGDDEWEQPEIYVDFSGPDSALLLDRGGELLRALELLAFEILRLQSGEHEKISFDCKNQRSLRLKELRMAASVARRKFGRRERRFILRRCRRGSGAWCIWRCGMKRTCVRRATAKGATGAWCLSGRPQSGRAKPARRTLP